MAGPFNEQMLTADWWSGVFGAPVTVGDVSRIGDGLVGMNLRVRLSSPEQSVPSSVVVKLPTLDPTSLATAVSLRNYEREVKFYAEIAPTVDIRVPACLHSEWDEDTHGFVLVLEDLAPAEQGNQITGCGLEHARAGIDQMVRLHGPRWDDATLWDLDWVQRRGSKEDGETLAMLYAMVKPGFLATFGEAVAAMCGDEGIALVHGLGEALISYVVDRNGPMTVTHGDYRLDNMLFAGSGGGVPCAVVDWQTPTHGYGPSDLAYFLGAGLVVDDRRRHEQSLLEAYRSGLRAYGVDVDAGWLELQYRREAVAGVIMAVVASQIVQRTERGDKMFEAMATRHTRHALDAGSLGLI